MEMFLNYLCLIILTESCICALVYSTSCHHLELFLLQNGGEDATVHDFGSETASQLNVCGNMVDNSCCGDARTLSRFLTVAGARLNDIMRGSNASLLPQLDSQIVELKDVLHVAMASVGEKIHIMFDTPMFGAVAPATRTYVDELVTGLSKYATREYSLSSEQHSSGASADNHEDDYVDRAVLAFFEHIFPHVLACSTNMSEVLCTAAPELSDEFVACARNASIAIWPYGDGLPEFAQQLSRSLSQFRLFMEGLHLLRSILVMLQDGTATNDCRFAIARMHYCPMCVPLQTNSTGDYAICPGYCQSVMSSCIGSLLRTGRGSLAQRWPSLIGHLGDLANQMQEPHLDELLRTFQGRIHELIVHMLERTQLIKPQVERQCGPIPSSRDVEKKAIVGDQSRNFQERSALVVSTSTPEVVEKVQRISQNLTGYANWFVDMPAVTCRAQQPMNDRCWNGKSFDGHAGDVFSLSPAADAQSNPDTTKLDERYLKLQQKVSKSLGSQRNDGSNANDAAPELAGDSSFAGIPPSNDWWNHGTVDQTDEPDVEGSGAIIDVSVQHGLPVPKPSGRPPTDDSDYEGDYYGPYEGSGDASQKQPHGFAPHASTGKPHSTSGRTMTTLRPTQAPDRTKDDVKPGSAASALSHRWSIFMLIISWFAVRHAWL